MILNKTILATELPDNTLKLQNTICPNRQDLTPQCQCDLIERVDHIKCLGVTVDQHLSFKQHTSSLLNVHDSRSM